MSYLGLLLPGAILVALIVVAMRREGMRGLEGGFGETWKLLKMVAPNLAIGFTLAGFLTLLLPEAMIAKWLGEESGWKGLLAGTLGGAVTPGGPFTHFPIMASLIAKGATVGPVCAYIASWALLGVHRIVIWEAPILGWRFVALRVASAFFVPPLVGFLAQVMAVRFRV